MQTTKTLRLETFEDRIVPTVNVMLDEGFDPSSTFDDVLTITGDDTSEHIHVKISPLYFEINGIDGTEVVVDSSVEGVGDPQNFFLGKVVIDMNDGNDTVSITNSAMFNGLTLNMGAGNDDLSIDQNSGVVGLTEIRLGKGRDQATVYGQYFGQFKMYGGGGRDTMLIGSGVQTEMYVYGGGGRDHVTVQNLYIPNGMYMDLGNGNDTMVLAGVSTPTGVHNGGDGDDTVELYGVWLGNTESDGFED